MDDKSGLDRFIEAQQGVYAQALREIHAGRKSSHWMWFVFPQIAGLGSSPTAQYYALASLEEARTYLAHPVLGPRLRDCAQAVVQLKGRTAAQVFGAPDDVKLRSSLTLFEAAALDEPVFGQALDALCEGRRDPLTLAKLEAEPGEAAAP